MGRAGAGASRPGVRRILVKGVSPRTMQALVFYLYTNQVHFVAFPHLPADGKVNDLHEEALEQMGDGSKQNPALWPPAFSRTAQPCSSPSVSPTTSRQLAFHSGVSAR